MADETLVPWSKYTEDPAYAELPTQQKLDLFKGWHKATVDNVVQQGLVETQEDEDYLNQYLTQAYDSVLDTQSVPELLGNAVQRSFLRAQQAGWVAGMATGALSPGNEASSKLAEVGREIEKLPSSSLARKIGSDEVGLWTSLAQEPAKGSLALSEFLLENLPAQILTTGASVAVGSALAGPVGAGVAGASSGGGSSLMMEYSGSVLEQLSKKGVDTNDPRQIAAAFNDQEFFKEINEKALKKGLPPAALDAAASVLATVAGAKAARGLKAIKATGFKPTVSLLAKEGLKELGSQATLGMAGEAGGQFWSEGKITSTNQIYLEGLLEAPGNVAEFAGGFGKAGFNELLNKVQSDPVSSMRAKTLAENLQQQGTIDQAAKLSEAGAPETAKAVVQAEAKSSLESEIDQAQETPIEQTKTEPAEVIKPVENAPGNQEKPQDKLEAQNTLEAARVWGNIRARKPVSADEVERLGFMLPASWKLNEQTGNFEFQGVPDEAQKGETAQAPAITPAAEPVVEAQAPAAEAPAPAQAEQPAPAQQGQAAVAPALKYIDSPQSTRPRDNPLSPSQPIIIRNRRVNSATSDSRIAAEALEKFLNNQPLSGMEVYKLISYAEREGFSIPFKSSEDGRNEESTDPLWTYDEKTDTWSKKDSLPTNRKLIFYTPDYTKPGATLADIGSLRYDLLPDGSTIDPLNNGATIKFGDLGLEEKAVKESEAAVAPALKQETPKETADLPAWEQVEKNKNQIRFLKAVYKTANARLPQDQRVEPKAGWKRGDYYKNLENIYGKISGLEKPIDSVPGVPETVQTANEEQKRRGRKKADLKKKLYNVRDSKLTGEQQTWKEMVFSNMRRIANEVAQRYANIPNVDDYIFDDLLRKTANYLAKNPVITEEQLTDKAVSSILASWADDSAKDAGQSAKVQELMKTSPLLEQMDTSDKPARTQTELDEEEKAAGETRQLRAQTQTKEAPGNRLLTESGYNPAREKLGPDQKLILDWILNKLTGAATPSGIETKNLNSYEDLAKFLSTLNKKKTTAKAVSKMATEAREALASELQKAGVGVTAEQISTALTPEGEQARARAKAKADKDVAIAKERQEKQKTADRGRNATQNQYLAEKLVAAGMESTPESRQRLVSEVLEPLENGTLEDAQAEDRISNIQKGQPNEKIPTQPQPREPVSRGRKRTGVRQQPGVNEPSGPGTAPARGTPVPVGIDQGQGQPEQAAGSGTRPGGRGAGVGQEQREAAADVSPAVDIDPALESNNLPRGTKQAVKELLDVLRQINFPGKVRLGEEEGRFNPVYTRKSDREGLTIYVSPQALAAQKREINKKFGAKPGEAARRWAQYRFMVVATHETVHNVHLNQLRKEAGQLGLTFDQHLANEVKRVAKFLNRNRKLKKYVAYLYNQDRKFANNEQQYFEFIRMLVENETLGRTTESATMSAEDVAQFMDDEDRRWLVNFIETIVQGLTNIASRILGTNAKDAEYLSNTAKLLRQLNRDILNPPKKERVANNYVEPKQEFVAKESAADTKAAEEEVAQISALNNQSKKFLEEYAKELGIKVPTFKHTYTVFNEKTRKHEDKITYRPAWKKEQYVEAIKAKLKELSKKPSDILGAAPLRFKTEYGLMKFDEKVGGNQRGILKGLAADKNNTVPWINLKAKILKNTSRAESEWILPTLEALVRNERVDVDQAKQAMKALANNKVEVEYLTKPSPRDLKDQKLVEAAEAFNSSSANLNHRMEGVFFNLRQAKNAAGKTIEARSYDILQSEAFNELSNPFSTRKTTKEELEKEAQALKKEVIRKEVEANPNVDNSNLSEYYSAANKTSANLKVLEDEMIALYAKFAEDVMLRPAKQVEALRNYKAFDRAFTLSSQIEEGDKKRISLAVIGNALKSSLKIEAVPDRRLSVKYTEVNPKPLRDMPELREVLVRAPEVTSWQGHYPEKNVLGFGRMYSTTLNTGKKGTFVFEVQSDAGKSNFDPDFDPDDRLLTVRATEQNLITAFQPQYGNRIVVANQSFNPFSQTDVIPPDARDDLITSDRVLKGDLIADRGDEEPPEVMARKIGENLYNVPGVFSFELERLQQTAGNGLVEIVEDVTPTRDEKIGEGSQKQREELQKNQPLLDAYESLVLKSVIKDALARDEDFIAITDAETAAMTEGHLRVKDGMRVHYDPKTGSLHNLAKKLTGDAGTAFDDGRSTYSFDNEKADTMEQPQFPRYPKENVTGVAYSLDRLKALGEASPANDILGAGAVPSDRPTWLKPDGETIAVDEDVLVDMDGLGNHSKAALEYLTENEPDSEFLGQWKLLDPFQRAEQSQRVVEEMLQKGWVRVVGDGFNIYFEGSPNETQFNKLYEAAIEDEARLIQDLTGITGRPKSRVVYEPPTAGIIGAAAVPRRGFITSRRREQSRGTVRLPDGIEDLALVKFMDGGSHPVALYENTDGDRFIVKTGQSRQQFENEVAAENVYRVLGYPVADSKLIEVDGQPAKIAEYLTDGFSLREFREAFSERPDLIQKVYDDLADGMLIDAYLFNYDSIGVNMQDNVLIRVSEVPSEDGETTETVPTVYRIDSGGTFDTKAFEDRPRNEPFFYDSLKVMQQNYPYLRLSASDLIAQISDLVLNSDAVLNAVPQRLQTYMANRLQYMADQLSAVDILTPVTGMTEQQTETFFETMREQMAAVQVTRDDRGRLINAATGMPSMVSGLGPNDAPVAKSEFRYRLERTPLFKAWFGDWENNPGGRATSKVLDEAGEPRLMYHGTGKYIQRYSDLYLDEVTRAIKTPSYIRRFGMNRFKGVWTSTKRSWAEKWANSNNPEGEYHEQVVFPMYVKSTNPFDPRNRQSVERLLAYLKDQGQRIEPEDEYSLLNGLFDWQFFEGAFDEKANQTLEDDVVTMPNVEEMRATGQEEETIRKRFAKTFQYRTLKAIVDLGHDGLWVQENLNKPELYRIGLRMAEGVINDPSNKEYKGDFDSLVEQYNSETGTAWNLLAFRRDGVKSAMNTGLFSSIKDPAALKRTNEAAKLEKMVTVDSATGRNKLAYQGQTLYSTDSPAALAAYAVANPSSLARHNIAKLALKNQPGSFIYQQRTAPSPTTAKKYPVNDILGAAEVRPRRFGVKLSKVLSKKIMDALRNKNYETLPDGLAVDQAKAYFEKHGLEKSAADVLSDDSPVRAGVQEILGMMVIDGYRKQIAEDPEASVKLASFVDEFMTKSTETGRALRAYRFISMLGPEGLQALYYKKARKRDAVMRELFQNFVNQAAIKLEPLSQEALEKVIKEMEGVLKKAGKLARTNTRRIAAKTTMTLWQQFSEQVGKSMADKVNEKLAALDQENQQEEGDATAKEVAEAVRGAKPKTINQEAAATLRKIRAMIDNLAREQGTEVKEAEIVADPENFQASDEQIQALRALKRKEATIERFSDLLGLWPKALQAWLQIKDTIREEIAINPKLAPLFDDYLKTALDQPFTMPQIRNLMKASDIDLKELIRNHYRQGTLGQQSSDLARLFMEEVNLGVLGTKTKQELAEAQGFSGKEAEVGVGSSIAEKLQEELAKKIEATVRDEALKILTNLIKNQADRRLEPSLKRFLDRLVKLSSYGLLDSNNIQLWNQFAEQEGLTNPKLAEEVYNLAKEAEAKPEGYQRNQYYQKALRAIYEGTEMNKWDYVMTWWYMSILSGWDTQGANLVGNFSQSFIVMMPDLFFAALEGKAGRKKAAAMLRGMETGWNDLVNIFLTGSSFTKQTQLTLNSLQATDTGEMLFERGKGWKKGIGATSSFVRRIMSGVDSFFYNANKEYYLYKYAYDQAYNDGKSGLTKKEASARALELVGRDTNSVKSAQIEAEREGFKQGSKQYQLRVMEILDQRLGANITESGEQRNVDTQALLNESVATALNNTYQQEPRGWLGTLTRVINILAAQRPETRFVIPFTRIVGNVWNMSLDMSGLGLVRYYGLPTEKLIGRRLGQWDEVTGSEREMLKIRALLGLTFVGLAAAMAALGYDKDYEKAWFRINGSGPENPQAKQALMKTGWKPWSFKVGGRYYSFLPTPLAIPLAVVGEIVDNYHYKKTGTRALFNVGHAAIVRAALVPFDMMFLSGLSDFFKMTDSSQPEQAEARAKAFVSRLGSSLLVPNLVKDIDQKAIPWLLKKVGISTSLDNKTAKEGLLNGIFIANTPILRRYFGRDDIDVLGNPIEVTSRITTARRPDPLVETLALKNAFPSPARRERLLGMIPMEDEEFFEYRVYRGKMLNQILNKPEMIERLRNSKSFVAQEIVKEASSIATEYAKGMVTKKMVESNDPRIQKLRKLGELIQKEE